MSDKLKMDAVDEAQQREIEDLKKRDLEHDNLFNRIYIFFFLTVLALFISAFITYPFWGERPKINIMIDKQLMEKLNNEK